MVRVTIRSADGASTTLDLEGGALVLGRDPTCDVVLDHPEVSRRHAVLQCSAGSVTIRDLGSQGGIWVDGSRIARSRRIGPTDQVRIGGFVLSLEGAQPAEPDSGEVSVVDGSPVRPEGVLTGAFTENPILDRLRQLGALADPVETAADLRLDPVSLLLQITERLHATPSTQAYLEEVLALACEGIGAETGAVVTLQTDGGVHVLASRHPPAGGLKISRTIVGTAIAEGAAVAASDATRDARFEDQESITLMDLRSVLCVPLQHGGEGPPCAFYLTRERAPFDHDTQLLAAAIAHLAALGMERARLREQAARARVTRRLLSRFHGPDVIEALLARGDEAEAMTPRLEQAEATVMFCDLVGFTRLCERATPLQVGEILNVFYRTMTEIIFELGGTVDKYIGDCVMALFGVPITRPDDAGRAAEAALRMRKRFIALRDARCPWLEEPLDLRIGLNTGPVVAGTVGSDLRLEYTALGDTVNVAQRLESAAQPGQILVGPKTREALGDAFRVEALDVRSLKGRTAAVQVFELLGRMARPAA